jgi:uncharacterized membrane protein YqjE
MKYPFNKIAAIFAFLAIYIAYLISLIIQDNFRLNLTGFLLFWTLGLYACIITGLMIHPDKIKKKIGGK